LSDNCSVAKKEEDVNWSLKKGTKLHIPIVTFVYPLGFNKTMLIFKEKN
jgi:hypothetical protein